MHYVIDLFSVLFLLYFFATGWRDGFQISLMKALQVVLAPVVALPAGRYLGSALGQLAGRPRIVTIPAVAVLAAAVVVFIFHLMISRRKAERRQPQKGDDYKHPLIDRLIGSLFSLGSGVVVVVVTIWLIELSLAGIIGQPLPGAEQSHAVSLARQVVYETASKVILHKGSESQAATLARSISRPAQSIQRMLDILAADSVQTMLNDPNIGADLLSGDPGRIEENLALQKLFADQTTLLNLEEMGVLFGTEQKSALCGQLAQLGQNVVIRTSLQNLQAKGLLSPDQLPALIRDPDFDMIVGELLN